MKFSTTGLILHGQNIGEQDKLVTVLTQSHGVVRAFVRRAKNIKSPKCASTGLLCYSKLMFYENKGTYSIDEAQSIEQFIGLRNNVENLSLAQYFCELCIHLCPKEAPANEFLSLVLNALFLLSKEKKNPLLIKACVEMKIMQLCGYMPDLIMCNDCGVYQSDPMLFIPKTGKLFCANCAEKSGAVGMKLPLSVITALRHTIYADTDKLFSFELKEELLKPLNSASENYVSYMTERDYQTLQFYKAIKE